MTSDREAQTSFSVLFAHLFLLIIIFNNVVHSVFVCVNTTKKGVQLKEIDGTCGGYIINMGSR